MATKFIPNKSVLGLEVDLLNNNDFVISNSTAYTNCSMALMHMLYVIRMVDSPVWQLNLGS